MAGLLPLRRAVLIGMGALREALARIAAKRRRGEGTLPIPDDVEGERAPAPPRRPSDPWYRDERREAGRSCWITRRPRWLTRE